MTQGIGQFLLPFAGEEGGAFDRECLGEEDAIAGSGLAGLLESVFGGDAEELTDKNDAIETGGDLGVAADQGNLALLAGLLKVTKEGLDGGFGGTRLGEEGGDEEPARSGAHAGEVVGVDVDEVTSDGI